MVQPGENGWSLRITDLGAVIARSTGAVSRLTAYAIDLTASSGLGRARRAGKRPSSVGDSR